eukprot:PhF_6_TR11184/c0_g1_i1/m.18024
MLNRTAPLHYKAVNRRGILLNGAPGPFAIRIFADRRIPPNQRFEDLVVVRRHTRYNPKNSLVHYLGKHVPHPQKSLWSPDTPVPQDRHLFKLTTMDVDAFKYFFGVQRSDLEPKVWEILSHSGLVPPPYEKVNYLAPMPIYNKAELYKYYLKNRPSVEDEERRRKLDYEDSLVRTEEERAKRRPQEPWM